jgi:hypothetical protein
VRKDQQATFAAARPLGHGTAMDGHEWSYMVRGKATKLVGSPGTESEGASMSWSWRLRRRRGQNVSGG